MRKPILYVAVGIPASGKSTRAKQLERKGIVAVSSDTIREELFSKYPDEESSLKDSIKKQYTNSLLIFKGHNIKNYSEKEKIKLTNQIVFKELYKRVHKLLDESKDVYYDGTNIAYSHRKSIIEEFGNKAEIICEFFTTPLNICLERNSKRDRQLDEQKIRDYKKYLRSPNYNEGFNKIYTIDQFGNRNEVPNRNFEKEINYGKFPGGQHGRF